MTSDQSRSSIDFVFCSDGFLFELLDAFCDVVVVVYGTLRERVFRV